MTGRTPVEKALFNTKGIEKPLYDEFPDEFENFKNISATIDYDSMIMYLEFDSVHERNNEKYENYHLHEFDIIDVENNKVILESKRGYTGSKHIELLENTGKFRVKTNNN